MRTPKPFGVYKVKLKDGEGYKVATYNNITKEAKIVTTNLTYQEADQVVKGYFMAGYSIKGEVHEADLE